MKVKLFVVDDHEIVRHGLIQLLKTQDRFEVCGEAADVNSAIKVMNKFSVDLAIVDINLDGLNGIDLIKAIKLRYKKTAVLALSMHGENDIVERALNAGAKGYVLKSAPINEVIDAINSILNGKTYLSPVLKDNLLEKFTCADKKKKSLECLTDREFEIFILIGEGRNRREISERLNLNSSTIGTYRDRIKNKLDINSPAELARFAAEWVLKNQKHKL